MSVVNNAEADTAYQVNALLKLTEYNFQNNKLDEARNLLTQAENKDSLNPDVHYIRSQVSLLVGYL